MRRLAILALFLTLFLNAQIWEYEIHSPLFGTLGTIKVAKLIKGNSYRIVTKIETKGVASVILGDRVDNYISSGIIYKKRFYARDFKILRNKGGKKELLEYKINPKTKIVKKYRTRWKDGKRVPKKTRTLTYYAYDDLATIYFNFPLIKPKKGSKRVKAVGTEKIGGYVVISIPDEKIANKERKKLKVGKDTIVAYFIAKREVLGEGNRKFVVALDSKGILKKAYFVAIPVVGDLIIKRK